MKGLGTGPTAVMVCPVRKSCKCMGTICQSKDSDLGLNKTDLIMVSIIMRLTEDLLITNVKVLVRVPRLMLCPAGIPQFSI